MKIIDAIWEQRNLGVKTYEITIESEDDLLTFADSIKELDGQYLVVKASTDLRGVTDTVQNLGFKFIEDMIHVEHDLREVSRNRILQRLYEETTFRKMNEQDIQQMYEEIQDGMFENDRISNDAFFGKKKAAERYMNWIKDLIDKGAFPYVIRYREDNTGFVILQTADGKIYHSVLGGGYKKYRKSGMGIIQKEQEIVKSLGGKKVITSVSSNNANQLKALILNGYMPYGVDHIFVKHVG
ncbi:MAG: hypothetical protein IJ065_11920 [Eubacterium sp.]|nr:hypothetical protein [Eubacterium sp.]